GASGTPSSVGWERSFGTDAPRLFIIRGICQAGWLRAASRWAGDSGAIQTERTLELGVGLRAKAPHLADQSAQLAGQPRKPIWTKEDERQGQNEHKLQRPHAKNFH